MKRPNLEIHIEELILRGMPPGSKRGLAEAIEAEVRRLIQEGGMPPGWENAGGSLRLPGGRFDVDPMSKPAAIGAQVAQGLHRGWSGPKKA
ncbi:MAG TPA: hypothetical protein VE685_12480 [Thermoanaerobaculia bacterium]|nr:hypothetical protein [Thermoanaerobaculia bacterium]